MMKHSHISPDDGFSLVELLVAVAVGAMVLTGAVAVLVSTNSAGVQLMSKHEITQDTRSAMTQVVKSLGSAQSMLRCTIWKNADEQEDYQTYNTAVQNWLYPADPQNPGIEPSPYQGDPTDCLEYYETGDVVLRALPNSICWYEDMNPGGSTVIDFTRRPEISCLFRGGTGQSESYVNGQADTSNNPASFICPEALTKATDGDILYYVRCRAKSGFSYFVASESAARDNFDYITGTLRPLVDLNRTTGLSVMKTNIFTYTTSDGGYPDQSTGVDTKNIEYVNIDMDIIYPSGKRNSAGVSVNKTYKFSQTVLLQGVKAYADQGAYADKFTG